MWWCRRLSQIISTVKTNYHYSRERGKLYNVPPVVLDLYNESKKTLTGGSLAGSTGMNVDSGTGQKLSCLAECLLTCCSPGNIGHI